MCQRHRPLSRRVRMNTALAFLAQNRDRLRLDQHGIPPQLSALVLTPRFQASRHVVFLLMAKGGRQPVLVAKLPRLVDTNQSLAREAASLTAVQNLRPSGFDSVPRLIAFETYGGRSLLVETALGGPPMDPATVRRDPDGCCRLAIDWMLDLHAASAHPAGADWFVRLVEEPLAQFAAALPMTEADASMI